VGPACRIADEARPAAAAVVRVQNISDTPLEIDHHAVDLEARTPVIGDYHLIWQIDAR
jgi:hypothetical protein